MADITLYSHEEDGLMIVFDETIPDLIRNGLGDTLKTHEITLRKPITQRLREEAEGKMWVNRIGAGFIKDEELRKRSYLTTFIESWKADGQSVTVDDTLHPNLVDMAYLGLVVQVQPSPYASKRVMALLQWDGEKPSGSSVLEQPETTNS